MCLLNDRWQFTVEEQLLTLLIMTDLNIYTLIVLLFYYLVILYCEGKSLTDFYNHDIQSSVLLQGKCSKIETRWNKMKSIDYYSHLY